MRAIGLMLGEMEAQRDDPLGLYWEGYGLDPEEPVEVSVTLRGEDGGLVSALGRMLGIGSGPQRSTVNWVEPPRDEPDFRRAITLDLRGLDAGTYQIQVTLTPVDGPPLQREAKLRILEGAG